MLLLLQAMLSSGRPRRDAAHADERDRTTGAVILIAVFAGLAIAAGVIFAAKAKKPDDTRESAEETDSMHWNPLDRV